MESICPTIQLAARQIAQMPGVQRILLFNRKQAVSGETTSFKLCIITGQVDKKSLCHKIYLEVDCDLPYDLVLYTEAEWESLLRDESTFASRVHRTGQVIYG